MNPIARIGSRGRRIAVAVIVVVVGFGIVGAFALPAAVRWGLESAATEAIGRQVRVDDVSANPYTLRVTLRGLTVEGQAGAGPLLTVRQASLNASIASLLRLAPVLEAVTVEGLAVHVVRLDAQRFDFSDIVDRLQARPASDPPTRFSVHNVQFTDGTIELDDRVTGGRHAVSDLRIGIPFLSNLPVDIETTVQPALSGHIDGAPFEINGETLPFHASHESSIALDLDGLDLARFLAYSPVKLPFEVPSGKFDTALRLFFRQAVAAGAGQPAQPARVVISGSIAARELALTTAEAPSTRLAAWKSVAVTIEEFEPLQRRIVVADLQVDSPDVAIARNRDGSIDWMRLVEPVGAGGVTKDKPAPAPPATPYAITLKHAALRNGRVRFADASVGRFEREIVDVQAEANDLTTAGAGTGKVSLSARVAGNGSLSVDGDLGLAPLAGRLRYAGRDLRPAAAAPYIVRSLDATVDGTADVDGVLQLRATDTGPQIALTDVAIAARSLRIRGTGTNRAALDIASLSVSGGAVDLASRRVTVEKVALDGPRLVARRLRDGTVDWQQIVAQQTRAGAQEGSKAAASDSGWRVLLKQADIARGDAFVEDAAVEPAVRLRAAGLSVSVKNIVGDGSEPATFTLRAAFGGGTLSATGQARWDALSAQARIDARNLDIAALRPYFASRLNATLAKAELSGRGTVDAKQPAAGAPLGIRYRGTARVANLHALDASGETDLLKWQVLDLDGIDVQAGEGDPVVSLGKATLSDFYARVIVSEHGRLNLADLVKSDAPAEGAAAAEGVPASPATIRIGAIEFVRGNVNFTDNFVKPNYSANMTGLGGSVSALASDSTEPATMHLAGEIDDEAPVEIRGRLNPLAPNLFLDIEGRTRSVDLPRMTPYSVKYAGYPILKGKLSMDVKYRLEDRKLQASNHLFLDQLTFGAQVESPTATKLPVLLAVALLKNARGEIDINLPISGSLDDPKFSVGGIIVQVIVNLLTKAVTAPFALLASAFGGGEELGFVEFTAGSATLGSPQVERLDALARALTDRPALKLDITGRVDPAGDAEGVRRAKYESKLRAAKVRQLTRAGGDSVDPTTVSVSTEERPALVAAVYAAEEIPDKPRNVLGIARTLPVHEMEQRILAHIAVTSDDLRALANARASAVRNHLEHRGKVARERLFLVEPKLTAEGLPDKGAPTRVDFSLK